MTNGTVPLYRYFNTDNGDWFYTTDWNELNSGVGEGNSGYQLIGIVCYLLPATIPSSMPLSKQQKQDRK